MGDHVAVASENRKLLAFPVAELPEMPRGKGEVRVPPVAEVAVDPEWWLLRARR